MVVLPDSRARRVAPPDVERAGARPTRSELAGRTLRRRLSLALARGPTSPPYGAGRSTRASPVASRRRGELFSRVLVYRSPLSRRSSALARALRAIGRLGHGAFEGRRGIATIWRWRSHRGAPPVARGRHA